jgi:hypothetical protein
MRAMMRDKGSMNVALSDMVDTVMKLDRENARLREAITEFYNADMGLRKDYSEYCDEEGYPPDWVYEQDEVYHDMWDKAVANLNEIAEEALRGGE